MECKSFRNFATRVTLHHGPLNSISHLILTVSSTPSCEVRLLECVGAGLAILEWAGIGLAYARGSDFDGLSKFSTW